MVSEIKLGNKIFALIVDLRTIQEGTYPVTNPKWSLQLLLMKRNKDHVIAKHVHKRIEKVTKQPQEAIIVIKGAIQISIFDRKGKFIAEKKVQAGECALILDGAHEVKMIKKSLVYAIKDGPYVDDKVFI
jgi:hypothetical protein